ncbi:ankyrin repeat domain-containing protein, partial [bacterium]|nr:ankyrin repeat domain-containing protein [bacterium]
NGADINMANDGGMTPLMQAVTVSVSKPKPALRFIEKFLTFKPKLDFEQMRKNDGGFSALHLAARFGVVDAAKLLLDAPALHAGCHACQGICHCVNTIDCHKLISAV